MLGKKMDRGLPSAKSAHSTDDRRKLQRVVVERGLCGLANDTKWDEFISAMRARQGWRPSYRYKCIDGSPSGWDVEWFHHLPFPLVSVEWLDVSFTQQIHRGMLVPPDVIDHSPWIVEQLRCIGFEYQRGTMMIRIFAYSPKNMDLFDL